MGETVSIHYAKAHFAKLLARVSAGEEIVIAKMGKPVARLSPITQRVPGIDKGKIWIAKDFNVMPEKELDDWYPALRG
jgi:prevent-host-death family protein